MFPKKVVYEGRGQRTECATIAAQCKDATKTLHFPTILGNRA